jgi:hypothetical protein
VAQPGAVFEVADGELHGGVAAVVSGQVDGGALAVGGEGVVAPVRPQSGLLADQAGAAHDQPAAGLTAKRSLGDLQDQRAGRTGAADARGGLVDEPLGAAHGVSRALAHAQMQHLAGVGLLAGSGC